MYKLIIALLLLCPLFCFSDELPLNIVKPTPLKIQLTSGNLDLDLLIKPALTIEEMIKMWEDDGAVRYERAKYTQRTFNKGIIERVPRTALEMKWQVPGGLEGIKNCDSILYKYIPNEVRTQREWITVLNGTFTSTGQQGSQSELAYTKSYPRGTYFIDVLRYQGKIFEARVREKHDDWISYIAYTNKKNRPSNYIPIPSRRCIDCHNTFNGPGTGGYGVGLVPGSDTVISDQFNELEY